MDNEQYFKTEDIVRCNARSELVLLERVGLQMKICEQQVEVAEIENTIMALSPSEISNCLVIKIFENGEDRLAAYVVSNNSKFSIESIRDYCMVYLCPHMVPSYFIVLDQFPSNANETTDRQGLTVPSPSIDISNQYVKNSEEAMYDSEDKMHHLWSSMLTLDSLSRHAYYFALGGTSCSLMQLFNQYQVHLISDEQFDVFDFLKNPTIVEHIRHLMKVEPKMSTVYSSLHLTQGVASFAQTQIFVEERLHSMDNMIMFHMPIVYRIDHGSLSLVRLRRALATVIHKHQPLRTRFIFDNDKNMLNQEVLENCQRVFPPLTMSIIDHVDDILDIVRKEKTNPSLFDLNAGRVIHCHVIRSSQVNVDEQLSSEDTIIFNFHRIASDEFSIPIFLRDLHRAYELNGEEFEAFSHNYIDYAVHEREMNMEKATTFWQGHLQGLSKNLLRLPYDRLPVIATTRSGRGFTV
ncbi:unnamed protein product, partial [Rotaria sp. Silwood2]